MIPNSETEIIPVVPTLPLEGSMTSSSTHIRTYAVAKAERRAAEDAQSLPTGWSGKVQLTKVAVVCSRARK